MHKLSTEKLLEVYKEAIESDTCKEFIILLSEEINKRLINESFIKKLNYYKKFNLIKNNQKEISVFR